MNGIRDIFQHFLYRLRETPLLLGWLLIGPPIALLTEGWIGFSLGLANIALVGFYAVLICWMTPNPPAPVKVKRPRLELSLAIGLFGFFLLIQLFDFGAWNIQPWQGYVRNFFLGIGSQMYRLEILPQWATQDVYLALSSTIKKLIPTVLMFLLLGYGRCDMGLARPHWKLSVTLVGITAAFGLLTGVLTRAPLMQVIALYGVGIFVNALPEELFFRAMLLPRLEKIFANPLNALVVSALLFNALHLPIAISRGETPLIALLEIFAIGYPSGLIWGYLYLRTRSIIPGTLWHAANGNLGFFMLSL